MYDTSECIRFSEALSFGKFIKHVSSDINAKVPPTKYDDVIYFHMHDGTVFKMYHMQDCCESVSIEDITGDIADLNDAMIIKAEERTSPYVAKDDWGESGRWTFYDIQTNKGCVQLRWLGTSNGYYSEGVDIVKLGNLEGERFDPDAWTNGDD